METKSLTGILSMIYHNKQANYTKEKMKKSMPMVHNKQRKITRVQIEVNVPTSPEFFYSGYRATKNWDIDIHTFK